jgi:hypothetical protein
VKSIAEMTSGLKLTNEQADALIDKGQAAQQAFADSATATQALRDRLLDTQHGVGDTVVEAKEFAQAIASGQVPADALKEIYLALAQEHGPEFTQALEEAVTQLGLSKDQAAEILGIIEQLAEGAVVPVTYDISWNGSPPPGVGSPASPASPGGRTPTSSGPTPINDRQFGLLEGPIPGPLGAPRWMQAHGGELVVTPNQAAGLLRAIERGTRGDPEDRKLMVEQNRLLREQNELLRKLGRGPGRLAGSVV